MASAKSLSARVRKLELDARATQKGRLTRWVFVKSEEDLREKRAQEEPGYKYVYFHWVWDGDEIEI